MSERVLVLRDAVVKITQMLSGKGIRVTQRGINAYVECDQKGRPILVNLPYLPDNATEELCFAIQGFLDHEAAHILFTDFSVLEKATKAGCFSMFNILEDARIEKAMGKRFSGCASNLSVTGKFFLDKYTTPMMNEALAEGDKNKLVGVLMVPLCRSMAGQFVFKEFMADKMSHVKPVFDKIADLRSKIENASSTEECFKIAKEIEKRLRGTKPPTPPAPPKPPEGDEDEGDGDGMPGGKASKPKKATKPKAKPKSKPKSDEGDEKGEEGKGSPDDEGEGEEKKSKKPKGNKGKEEKEEKDDEEEDEGGASGKDGDKDDDEEGDSGSDDDADGDEDEGGAGSDSDEDSDGDADGDGSSDEAEVGENSNEDSESETGSTAAFMDAIDKENANGYDDKMSSMISKEATDAAAHADYLPFTKDDDVIENLKVGSGYLPRMFRDMADKVDHMVGPLQKDLERAIAARSLSSWESGRRSGRLAPANLSRLASGDTRVFRRKHETTSKDVAVLLLVDASGSMSGEKIHLATQAAYALSSVLERIGIKHEVMCFTTGLGESSDAAAESRKLGRGFSRVESLYMPILKGFEERLTAPVRDRFGWLPNSRILRNNVDGECVEVAARRLKQRRETGKVMMVLSDGAPNAYGAGADLDRHLVKVVKDVAKSGVNIVGIGVMTDCVKRYYPKNVVINNVAELPDRVIKELRHLLVQ